MNAKKLNSLIALVVIAFLLLFGVIHNSKILLFQKLDNAHNATLLNETIALTKELAQENEIYDNNKNNNEKPTKSSAGNSTSNNGQNLPVYNNFLDMFSMAMQVFKSSPNIKTHGTGRFAGEINSIIKVKVNSDLKYVTEISNFKNKYAYVAAENLNLSDLIKNLTVPMVLHTDGTINKVFLMDTLYSFTPNYFTHTLKHEIGDLFYNINSDTIKQVLLFNYDTKRQTYYAEILLHNNAFALYNALFKLSTNIDFVNMHNFQVVSSILKIQVNRNCQIQYISSSDVVNANFSASIISGQANVTLSHTQFFEYLEHPFALSGNLI